MWCHERADAASEVFAKVYGGHPPTASVVERLRDLSFALAVGGSEETDPLKLVERIEWGVKHIQQVEVKRTADLIEELSKEAYSWTRDKPTWGSIRAAVLARAFPAPVREQAAAFDAEMDRMAGACTRSGAQDGGEA
jgi:hypothetical protein